MWDQQVKQKRELELSKETYPLSDLKSFCNESEKLPVSRCPLIKTECIYDSSDNDTPYITMKKILYMATELVKFRKEYSQTPKESEIEYVWRVSLTWGDQILFSEKETEGCWGQVMTLISYPKSSFLGWQTQPPWRDSMAMVGNINQIVELMKKLLVGK